MPSWGQVSGSLKSDGKWRLFSSRVDFSYIQYILNASVRCTFCLVSHDLIVKG